MISRPPVLGMLVGPRYIVTRASKHRELQVGDRIRLCADGCIENIDAAGWMPADDVHAATAGAAVHIDAACVASQRAKLEAQLAALNSGVEIA